MTNDKKSKTVKKKITEHKGVSITGSEIEDVHSKISDENELYSEKSLTVGNVREELKNVIERMGPDTPLINTDTDNEDSTYSTSIYSAIQIQEISTINEKNTNNNSTEEESLMTIYNVSELGEYPIRTTETAIQTTNTEYNYPHIYNNIPPHICPHFLAQSNFLSQNIQENDTKLIKQTTIERASRFASWFGFKNKKQSCGNCNRNCDLYKINIEQKSEDESPPRRLVFDLMEEFPRAETKTIGTNTKRPAFVPFKQSESKQTNVNSPNSTKIKKQTKQTVTERVDIYYFDHGNAEYYQTTDSPPLIQTEIIAEKTDYYTKKFWAEFFGTFHIGVSFVVSFILQLIRFILQSIYRPLIIGVIQLGSDYCFKPSLAVLFNGIIQPLLIFLYNLATSIRDVCAPIANSIGYFIREVAVLLKSIRLVQIDRGKETKRTECGAPKEAFS